MATGKVPGQDGLPPELFKFGRPKVVENLVMIYGSIWSKQSVPQEFNERAIGPSAMTTKGSHCCQFLARY